LLQVLQQSTLNSFQGLDLQSAQLCRRSNHRTVAMDLTQLTTMQHNSAAILRLLSEANDPESLRKAHTILTEITNGKGLPPVAPLDQANSGSLQPRESISAAAGLEPPHEAAEKEAVADREPAPHTHQTSTLARRESTSTEPSSGPLAAADTLDRDPAHYDLSGAVIESSSTLREAVRRLQAAEHNMPSYTRFISGTKGSASAPQCEKKPHSGRASPGTSTVKPQAATRLHKPNRSPDSARALASGNSQEAGRKQDAVKAQTQAIFSAQAAVKAMDALKAQHTGSLRGTDTPQDKSPLQAKPKPQPGTGSKDRSLSPNTGKAQASMPEPAPEPQDASDIQRAGALEGSGTESSLGKPQESIRPQLLNGWRLLPGQQPPLAALPDDIAAWDTPRLEQMPGRLPEPRFNSHLLHSASKAAVPALKAEAASSAYDSPRVAQSKGGEGGVVEESADGKWPAHVLVQCNGNQGKFLLNKQSMVCTCKLCQTKAAKLGLTFVDMTPTEFERHSGIKLSHIACCS